jgi:hypothetical protein
MKKLSSKGAGDSSDFGSKARMAMTMPSNKFRLISKQTVTSLLKGPIVIAAFSISSFVSLEGLD